MCGGFKDAEEFFECGGGVQGRDGGGDGGREGRLRDSVGDGGEGAAPPEPLPRVLELPHGEEQRAQLTQAEARHEPGLKGLFSFSFKFHLV